MSICKHSNTTYTKITTANGSTFLCEHATMVTDYLLAAHNEIVSLPQCLWFQHAALYKVIGGITCTPPDGQ